MKLIILLAALAVPGAEKRTVEAPSGLITYYVAGSGPTLVLLHGANHHAGGWSAVAKELAGDYRLVVPDLPGHGDSEPATGPLDYGMLLSGVRAVIDCESPEEPVTLVGNSMGGWLALLYARESPKRVTHIVLVDSSGISYPDYKGPSLLPTTREEAAKTMLAVTGPNSPPMPSSVLDDLVKRTPSSPMARLLRSDFWNYLLDGKLGDLPVPVTLIWGEDDGILPLEYARRLAAELPHANFSGTIPKCGHIPQVQCPRELVKALRDASL